MLFLWLFLRLPDVSAVPVALGWSVIWASCRRYMTSSLPAASAAESTNENRCEGRSACHLPHMFLCRAVRCSLVLRCAYGENVSESVCVLCYINGWLRGHYMCNPRVHWVMSHVIAKMVSIKRVSGSVTSGTVRGTLGYLYDRFVHLNFPNR